MSAKRDAMNPTDKVMLALAASTYRGITCNSESKIHESLVPWMPNLAKAGLGSWEIVWGPASFRMPTSLVDDAMAFVAHRTDDGAPETARWVVAIRGTNPVSLFDWLFGDFWVDYMVPWSADTRDALISASTSLGDTIIRNLAAEKPPSSEPFEHKVTGKLKSKLERMKIDIPELDPKSLLEQPPDLGKLGERIAQLVHAPRSVDHGRVADFLGGVVDWVADKTRGVRQNLCEKLLADFRHEIENTPDLGKTLEQFLNDAVPKGERVAVTGHSKGGALTHAAALWLAEGWAREKKAQIECFSFAGPTCGNAGFARHYNAALERHTRRIVNRRDVVPHAWDPTALLRVAKAYPELALAIATLARSVDNLDYTHLGGSLFEFDGGKRTGRARDPVVFAELIYQHLDAYLEEAELPASVWNTCNIMFQ